jgi:hypothetical protein
MRRWAKVVARVFVVVVAVQLVFAGATYVNAWYARWRAGRLLAVLKTMIPGVTTEADYLRAVKPWQDLGEQQDKVHPGEVEVSNQPRWVYCYGTLRALCYVVMVPMPIGTFFDPIPVFTNGKLAYLGIKEGQEPMSWRSSVVTQIYSKSYEGTDPELTMPFDGYAVSTGGRGLTGYFLTDVTLDERATPAERDSALDFSFKCFTTYRTCRDSAQFLRPAPNRSTHAVTE